MLKIFPKIRDQLISPKTLRQRVERDYPGVHDVISQEFDILFYLSTYDDVRSAAIDPISHYIMYGWKEGRNPCPDFSVLTYLRQNRDVDAAGVEPYWHYLVAGRAEGRAARTSEVEHVYSTIAAEFKLDFYLATNPDVRDAGVDAVEHYIRVGWKERRDPTPDFSSAYYLESNPDVREAGVNPFYHFLVAGAGEGRIAKGISSAKLATLENVRPLGDLTADWIRADKPPKVGTAQGLIETLLQARANSEQLLLSVSHDDYRVHTGGVQLCIQIEQTAFNQERGHYLHAYPWQPLPTLASEDDDDALICLSFNGKDVGVYRTSTVIAALSEYKKSTSQRLLCVVHSLLGHSPEKLGNAARGLFDESFIWAHDYLLLCSGYNLLRNTVSYCDGPSVDSGSCSICIFGHSRRSHIERIKKFIASRPFILLSPSTVARDILLSRGNFTFAKSYIAPHCSLEETSTIARSPEKRTIRVAFCGWPVYHKGWFSFEELAKQHAGSQRYQFYYFGGADNVPTHIEAKKVLVNQGEREAMTQALIEYDIDVVVLWANWPETFSFAMHEVLAAGCRIVTTSQSGNIAKIVTERCVGLVLASDGELHQAFKSTDVEDMVAKTKQKPRQVSSINYSRMTLDFISLEMKH